MSPGAGTRSRVRVAALRDVAEPAPTSAEVIAQELQRALAGERCGSRVVRTALVAVEAVVGRVDVHFDPGLRRRETLDPVDGNHRVALAEMREDGAARRLAARFEHSAAIVRD